MNACVSRESFRHNGGNDSATTSARSECSCATMPSSRERLFAETQQGTQNLPGTVRYPHRGQGGGEGSRTFPTWTMSAHRPPHSRCGRDLLIDRTRPILTDSPIRLVRSRHPTRERTTPVDTTAIRERRHHDDRVRRPRRRGPSASVSGGEPTPSVGRPPHTARGTPCGDGLQWTPDGLAGARRPWCPPPSEGRPTGRCHRHRRRSPDLAFRLRAARNVAPGTSLRIASA